MMVAFENIYRQCRAYARKLDRNNYEDIVHDAYLRFHKKTNLNLFEQDKGVALTWVKHSWFRVRDKSKARAVGRWRSDQARRVTVELPMYHPRMTDSLTPEDICIANDIHEQFLKLFDETRLELYLLAVAGYEMWEIAEKLNMKRSLVYYYFKTMRWTAAIYN